MSREAAVLFEAAASAAICGTYFCFDADEAKTADFRGTGMVVAAGD